MVEEGGEWEVGVFEGMFEEAEFGDHEFLVGGRDAEEVGDLVREVGKRGSGGKGDGERFGVVG